MMIDLVTNYKHMLRSASTMAFILNIFFLFSHATCILIFNSSAQYVVCSKWIDIIPANKIEIKFPNKKKPTATTTAQNMIIIEATKNVSMQCWTNVISRNENIDILNMQYAYL